jgi:hypothetical protein
VSARHPLAGAELVIVDGNNLLHRRWGDAAEGSVRGLLATLQSAIRDPVQLLVVLDGHPAPGSPTRQRVSARLELRHAGSRSADDLIVQLAASRPPASRSTTIVVTDDRALTERSRATGCRTQRLAWLQALLDRPRRAPVPGPPAPDAESPTAADGEREGWRPGRGATRKRGNPRRSPRRRPPPNG